MRPTVFLLYGVDKDSSSLDQLLERQAQYLSFRNNALDTQEVIVFTTGTKTVPSLELMEKFRVISLSSRNLSPMAIGLRSVWILWRKFKIRQCFLVIGNPGVPLISAFFIKLINPKTTIQVSIHTDISQLQEGGIKNKLKLSILKLLIPIVDVIRFVSEAQMFAAKKIVSTSGKTIVIAPIPISQISQEICDMPKEKSVGFVGRLHQERDVDSWIEIAENFQNLKLFVIGQGPEKTKIEMRLPHARMLGALSAPETIFQLSSFGVLLSTARYESYGLAIREALLCGVPVVSRSTAGIQDLLMEFPDLIKTFVDIEEAVNEVENFITNRPDHARFHQFREWFYKRQGSQIRSMVNLWR